MLTAVKGTIKGNTIVTDENIEMYNGREVIVTILDYSKAGKRKEIDWDSYNIPSERGAHVNEYMQEMRVNDRI